jgi:hypothetical protein
MKQILVLSALFSFAAAQAQGDSIFFAAGNPLIRYTGRIDFSMPDKPRFWNPGTYISIRFRGSYCDILVNDEEAGGKNHNYLEIVLDGRKPQRLKLASAQNRIHVGDHLSSGVHTLTIVKNTEAGIGWIEFAGIYCRKLLPAKLPSRKIECFGNSITCGSGSDTSSIPCGKGEWYDQHNAYLSYGTRTARALNAQYHLTAVSGIGLIHSCCNMDIVMPQVYDKISTRNNTIPWDFSRYQPDVVTICLGQNDGIRDSTVFCRAYTDFIGKIRKVYPRARIILLSSPMADESLRSVMIRYLGGIAEYERQQGDPLVSTYFFSRRYHGGCGDHPTVAEHEEIAGELTAYIKGLMRW